MQIQLQLQPLLLLHRPKLQHFRQRSVNSKKPVTVRLASGDSRTKPNHQEIYDGRKAALAEKIGQLNASNGVVYGKTVTEIGTTVGEELGVLIGRMNTETFSDYLTKEGITEGDFNQKVIQWFNLMVLKEILNKKNELSAIFREPEFATFIENHITMLINKIKEGTFLTYLASELAQPYDTFIQNCLDVASYVGGMWMAIADAKRLGTPINAW